MAGIEQLMHELPIADIAARLGVDEATATQAVNQALPALFGGLHANAQDPGGAQSITAALQQHDPKLLDGGVSLADVDESDGEKIVGHVFGDKRQEVVQTLGKMQGIGGGALQEQLLPLLAPIVLSFLAKQFGAGQAGSGAQTTGGGIGGALGDILGGGGQGGVLGDLLGGLVGGGGKNQGGNIGDILGGLLGKGRR